ncbi:MAG TPA: hypothetical protein VFV33_08425 [Gemmatimonadaceae bacterium]|nr:hypothetical protein [Gemmatimonadaceae bacterium]
MSRITVLLLVVLLPGGGRVARPGPRAITPVAVGQIAERRLSTVRTLPEPYSEITALRVLSDARALLLDGKEQELHLVDPGRGTTRAIGRVGAGPGEFRRGTALLPARGDTTLLVDGGNGRLLVVAPDGSLPAVLTPSERTPLARASAGDGAGSVYVTTAMLDEGPTTEKAPDSVRLARIALATQRMSPVASLAAPPTRIVVRRSGARIESIDIIRPPFAVGDAFAVAPGGRVAIARRSPYRLDQVMPDGRLVHGAPVSVPSIPVGTGEREEYLSTLVPRPSPESLEWPRALPPFPANPVLALANGETWVRRHVAARRDSTWYDVFDPNGGLQARLPLDKRRRILAVTAHGVYVARTDDDGLVYLEVATVR